jgi:SAM-dependent methyltransferase
MGDEGDFARRFVLDAPMLERVAGVPTLRQAQGHKSEATADVTPSLAKREGATALDIGCGEGRFCRLLQSHGLSTVGIDPTEALIARARERDPAGDYRIGKAETMEVAPGEFDLVVSYLSLIDIPDLARAAAAMSRALRPGGIPRGCPTAGVTNAMACSASASMVTSKSARSGPVGAAFAFATGIGRSAPTCRHFWPTDSSYDILPSPFPAAATRRRSSATAAFPGVTSWSGKSPPPCHPEAVEG